MSWWNRVVNSYVDSKIRAKVALHETPMDRFQVRIARTADEYRDAFALVHIAYAYLGIESVRQARMRITPQHLLPEATVFVVYEGDQPVGTMTVTADSPAGLPLDADYPAELAALRAKGRKLVEFGSLSVVNRCRHNGVPVLLAMAAMCWAHARGCDHLVIGVHPRASAYYRALYAIGPLGSPQRHKALAAPVCALEAPFERLHAHVRKTAIQQSADGVEVWRHLVDCPPSCVDLFIRQQTDPSGRDKLPREVFRELFVHETDRLETLDDNTRGYLETIRTEETLANDDADWTPRAKAPATPPTSRPRLRSVGRDEPARSHSYVREVRNAPARRRTEAS